MSGRCRSLVLAVLAAGGTARGGDSWDWRQPVRGVLVADRLYRVVVPPEVFDGCRAFPCDVRIVDRTGLECPFAVEAGAAADTVRVVATRPVGLPPPGSRDAYREADLKVLADPLTGGVPRHNRVIVRTGGRGFVRRVEVFGSEDGAGWRRLAESHLVDFDAPRRYSRNAVEYGASTARFVRVRVHPGAGDDPNAAGVLGAFLSFSDRAGVPHLPVRLAPVAMPAAERSPDRNVRLFDTGWRNHPLDRLRVTCRDASFLCPVRVFGRNEAEGFWRWVADGLVLRLGEDAQETVAVSGFFYRYLKVELLPADGRELAGVVVAAEYAPRQLIFQARSAGRVALEYGAEARPGAPAGFLTPDGDWSNATLLALGPRIASARRIALGREAAALLTGIVLAGLGVVGAGILFLRRGRGRGPRFATPAGNRGASG